MLYAWARASSSEEEQRLDRAQVLAGQPFVIVGVTAREFIGTTPNRPACWLPLMMRDALYQATQSPAPSWHTDRNVASFSLWGRVKPGVTTAQAQANCTP